MKFTKQDSLDQRNKMESSAAWNKALFIGIIFVGAVVYGWPYLMGIIG